MPPWNINSPAKMKKGIANRREDIDAGDDALEGHEKRQPLPPERRDRGDAKREGDRHADHDADREGPTSRSDEADFHGLLGQVSSRQLAPRSPWRSGGRWRRGRTSPPQTISGTARSPSEHMDQRDLRAPFEQHELAQPCQAITTAERRPSRRWVTTVNDLRAPDVARFRGSRRRRDGTLSWIPTAAPRKVISMTSRQRDLLDPGGRVVHHVAAPDQPAEDHRER